MATVAESPGASGVSIGLILSRAFGVMGANPVVIFGISCLVGALPPQLYNYFLLPVLASPELDIIPRTFFMGGSSIVVLLCSVLAQGAIIRASVAYANGEQASFGQCIEVGLAKALPLIGLSFLFMFGLMAGFLLFVVPAAILLVMWSVSTPALVAEPIGIFRAFGRSRYLTKGARWQIFGMLVLLFVLLWIFSMILGVLMATTGVPMIRAGLTGGHLPLWFSLVSLVSGTITTALTSTVLTSLYIALRNWKDGPQADALADIFA